MPRSPGIPTPHSHISRHSVRPGCDRSLQLAHGFQMWVDRRRIQHQRSQCLVPRTRNWILLALHRAPLQRRPRLAARSPTPAARTSCDNTTGRSSAPLSRATTGVSRQGILEPNTATPAAPSTTPGTAIPIPRMRSLDRRPASLRSFSNSATTRVNTASGPSAAPVGLRRERSSFPFSPTKPPFSSVPPTSSASTTPRPARSCPAIPSSADGAPPSARVPTTAIPRDCSVCHNASVAHNASEPSSFLTSGKVCSDSYIWRVDRDRPTSGTKRCRRGHASCDGFACGDR